MSRRPRRLPRARAPAFAADTFVVVPENAAPPRPRGPKRARAERSPARSRSTQSFTTRPLWVEQRCRSTSCSRSGSDAGAAYGVPWQVLAAINKIETELRQQHGPELGGCRRLDAVHAGHLAALGRRRQRRRRRRPVERRGRDLRRGALSGRVRRGDRPSARALLLQPRRLVRERGPRADVAVRRRHDPERHVRPRAGARRRVRAGRPGERGAQRTGARRAPPSGCSSRRSCRRRPRSRAPRSCPISWPPRSG